MTEPTNHEQLVQELRLLREQVQGAEGASHA